MEYVFLALAGWAGGSWAVTLGSAPRGYPAPDDTDPWPWPPCLACGGLAGLLAAIIFVALIRYIAVDGLGGPKGWFEIAVVGLVVGAAAGSALGAVNRLSRRGVTARN